MTWPQQPQPQHYPPPGAPYPQPPPGSFGPVAQGVHPGYAPPPADRDRWLIIAGVACVTLSVLGVVLAATGAVTSTFGALFVMVPVGVGIRVLLWWSAKSSSAARRDRVLGIVSWVGLGVSGLTLLIVLPTLTKAGGMDLFLSDLFTFLWTLVLLTLGAGAVRTMTGRAFVGAGLTGFLAVSALALVVTKPLFEELGNTAGFAAGWVPLIEESLKALPVVIVVWVAARRTARRPSATDLMLLGAWIGTGFALYEDALYGRGEANWGAAPLLSQIVPSAGTGTVNSFAMMTTGHLVWTALIGLGLGVAVLYRRRHRLAWLAAPVALVVAIGEHAVVNNLAVGQGSTLLDIARVLLLWGWLSAILLLGGTTWIVLFEWRRATRKPKQVGFPATQPTMPSFLWVAKRESARRSQQVAALQRSSSVAVGGRP